MASRKDEKSKPKQGWRDLIQAQEYNQKLNKLLSKIEIQNRYSNRITNLNNFNLLRFEKTAQELEGIKQARKLQEINEVQLRNLNSDLNKQIQELKWELQSTARGYLESKKQVKQLNERIAALEKQNILLHRSILELKNKSIDEVVEITHRYKAGLLESEVREYVSQANWKLNNALIDHCRECIINDDFTQFFFALQRKIQLLKNEQKSNPPCPRWSRTKSVSQCYQVQNYSKKNSFICSQQRHRNKNNQKIKANKRTKTLVPLNLTPIQ